MMTELRHVGVLRAGAVGAILYAFLGLIVLPLLVIGAIFDPEEGLSLIVAGIFMVIVYPLAGFLGGLLFAALYNAAARIVGGLQLEFEPVGAAGDHIVRGPNANFVPQS